MRGPGRGTTTLELTALRRPFLYFPLEGHAEQEVAVAGRLARHQAGVRMEFGETTPETLTDQIARTIDRPVVWPEIAADGTRNAAQLVSASL